MQTDTIYVDGAWVPSGGSATVEVVNPSTEQVITTIPLGTPDDVDRAVAAAVRAFETWGATSVDERAKYVQAIAEGLAARSEEIGRTVSEEMGMPLAMSTMIQAGLPAGTFAAMPQIMAEFTWEEKVGNSLVVREPVGVVGAITPWNYPLHQIAAKVAPALAGGERVVLKPSEVAPLNAYLLAEIIHDAGLPPGVFNLVTGARPRGRRGPAVAPRRRHDQLHRLDPGRPAGRRAGRAQTVKRVALELGGKSANVLLDDCRPRRGGHRRASPAATSTRARRARRLTRMLVPRDRHDEVVEIARAAAEATTVGDPSTSDAQLGPAGVGRPSASGSAATSEGHRARAHARSPAATSPRRASTPGYFVRPTVFADVTPEMTIAQEEIFGPVLSIMPYDDEDDAVRIANATIYGLAGAVRSGDEERAGAGGARLRTGQVDINQGGFNLLAPFGGYRQSGNGRELGKFGLDEFLETKSLQLPA